MSEIPLFVANTIVDPKAYANDRHLHSAFAWLRKEMPLAVAEPDGFDPFWAVTKHADILEVSKNNSLFHNGDRQTTLATKEADQKVRAQTGGSPHLVRTLVQMDEPDHMKYRALTQAWFMPGNVKKREESIRAIAKTFVDKMADLGGECDFVTDVALYYPLRVIMEIFGIPETDEPRMLKLTQELFGAQDKDQNRGGKHYGGDSADEALANINAVLMDFFMYFNALTLDRRAAPKDDVATIIANGKIDGEEIGGFEAMSYYVIIATAGHDTTSSSTAGGMQGLLSHPEQFAKLKADPALIAGLVDESIRWTTPVQHFMRSATADTELAGRKIAKGDWLMLCYPSGNRDEDVFENPFAFDVTRNPNKHLAFGYGAHLCLGQHLAKLEMKIFWEELLPRLKSIEPAGPSRRTEANFVGGLKSLPLRYKMA
jgi:cytochrome P450